LPLPGWKVRRTISIVRNRDAMLTPAARAFVAMIRARRGKCRRDREPVVAEN
jgi:hypothetical protein